MNYNYKLLKFIDDFEKMLKQDKYINKKIVDELFDNNKFLLKLDNINGQVDKNLYSKSIKIVNDGYRVIELHNKNFIDKKLIEYKDYFDNMFKKFDSNICQNQMFLFQQNHLISNTQTFLEMLING